MSWSISACGKREAVIAQIERDSYLPDVVKLLISDHLLAFHCLPADTLYIVEGNGHRDTGEFNSACTLSVRPHRVRL